MPKSRTLCRAGWGLGAFVVAVASSGERPASAALTINLAFADGSSSMSVSQLNAGQDIPIRVYATINGSTSLDQSPTADGLQYTYLRVVSLIGGTGAVPGSIESTGAYSPTLNPTFATTSSAAGSVGDYNGDGVTDLGDPSTIANLPKPRAGGFIYSTGGSSPNVVLSGTNHTTVSFLVETIDFEVGSVVLPGESLTFSPGPISLPYAYTAANYYQDGTLVGSNPTVGSSVTFTTVPEPAAIGLLLGSLWPGVRRRAARLR